VLLCGSVPLTGLDVETQERARKNVFARFVDNIGFPKAKRAGVLVGASNAHDANGRGGIDAEFLLGPAIFFRQCVARATRRTCS
jgi:hypothetical protein